jgi:hypothetical protein
MYLSIYFVNLIYFITYDYVVVVVIDDDDDIVHFLKLA